MDIQHFVGENMRDAFAKVRETLGPDALILESKETSSGFEVSAVADCDPSELKQALEAAVPPVAASQAGAHTDSLSETSRLIAAAAKELAKAQDVDIVRAEMQSIRCLVESHLARAGWSETTLGSPGKANIMRNLSALGLAPDVVRQLIQNMDVSSIAGQAWAAPMKTLMDALPVIGSDAAPTRGVVAVVGPSGAGKTTTVAKLAAQYVQSHAASRIAIVTLDNHRIGAGEQIEIIGRLIGVPVLRPGGDQGIAELRELIRDKDLVLVDTVGMGQHDARLAEQLSRLRVEELGLATLLALPANIEHDAMQEILDAYGSYALLGCVLTKIDEAATLGSAFSVLIRSSLPLIYVSDGQRIPEDLHVAEPRRSWLIKRAIEMMRTRRFAVSERYMAENFCKVADERRA